MGNSPWERSSRRNSLHGPIIESPTPESLKSGIDDFLKQAAPHGMTPPETGSPMGSSGMKLSASNLGAESTRYPPGESKPVNPENPPLADAHADAIRPSSEPRREEERNKGFWSALYDKLPWRKPSMSPGAQAFREEEGRRGRREPQLWSWSK